jgi:uncharacterized Zn finger protein (UPF0148 family)
MALHCPRCGAAVFSRRNRLCSSCRQPLPADLLLTPAEVLAVEADEAERDRLAQLHEQQRRAECEARSRQIGDGEGPFMCPGLLLYPGLLL